MNTNFIYVEVVRMYQVSIIKVTQGGQGAISFRCSCMSDSYTQLP